MKSKRFSLMKAKNVLWFDKFLKFYYFMHHMFFCTLIWSGRKLLAFNSFIKIKEGLKDFDVSHPNEVFFQATLLARPIVYLKPIRMSRVTHKVPAFISDRKAIIFSIRLLLKSLKDKYRVIRIDDVIDTLWLASQNKGLAIEKKEEIYKISQDNRHFVFYLKK